MNIKQIALTSLVSLTALGASASIAPVASAADQPSAGKSKGFHIKNNTGSTLTLNSVTGDGRFEGRPEVGSVIPPGGEQDFELQYHPLDGNENDVAKYVIRDPATGATGELSVAMEVSTLYQGSVKVYNPLGTYSVEDTTIKILDQPGTVRDIPASESQKQADLLKKLVDSGVASATFKVTSQTPVFGPMHQIGSPVYNHSSVDDSFDVGGEDRTGTSDTIGGEISAGGTAFGVVETEVKAHYDKKWSTSHTFKQILHVNVKSHYEAWLCGAEPFQRYTGDFTVKYGNTTWVLHDVSFTSPDPNRSAEGLHIWDAPIKSNVATSCPTTGG